MDPGLGLLGVAAQGLVDAGGGQPESARRASAATTSSAVSVSTPRWLIVPVAGAGEQHQLERRVLDGEVGVAVADLGGGGTEHLGVEVDGG
jgi:hypothetical protein